MKSYRISHYRILEKLGAGGMGEVYKAYDETLDRPVALKILPPDLVGDEDRLRRFVQEAKSASKLNYPHIITIYEIGEAKSEVAEAHAVESNRKPKETEAGPLVSLAHETSIHYIAMEYIEGETLHAKIYGDESRLSKSLEYLLQVADGLAKAHAAGIVHRDLKPNNIMINKDGFAKILDFGLAKLVETAKELMKPPEGELAGAATVLMDTVNRALSWGRSGICRLSKPKAKRSITNQIFLLLVASSMKLPRAIGLSKAIH